MPLIFSIAKGKLPTHILPCTVAAGAADDRLCGKTMPPRCAPGLFKANAWLNGLFGLIGIVARWCVEPRSAAESASVYSLRVAESGARPDRLGGHCCLHWFLRHITAANGAGRRLARCCCAQIGYAIPQQVIDSKLLQNLPAPRCRAGRQPLRVLSDSVGLAGRPGLGTKRSDADVQPERRGIYGLEYPDAKGAPDQRRRLPAVAGAGAQAGECRWCCSFPAAKRCRRNRLPQTRWIV